MDATVPPPSADNPPAPSLLPASLVSPASVFWLWVLPIGLLLLLNFQAYQLIGGNLTTSEDNTASHFGLAGLLNLLLGLGVWRFSAYANRASIPTTTPRFAWSIPATAIAVQIAYLWFAFDAQNSLVPRSVAAWIYSPERFLFNQFSFAMLPLAHGILRLACLRVDHISGGTAARHLALAVVVPILFYLIVFALASSRTNANTGILIGITGSVALCLAVLVIVIRSLLVILHHARRSRFGDERVIIVLVALVLPLVGLLINRAIPFPADFQSGEVYTLVLLNTAILLFASLWHERTPLLSFGLLCTSFPFSLYFFIVFLPYTPLSVLGLIVFGLGMLVLSPSLLLVVHLHLLNATRRHARLTHDARRLTLTGLVCASLLPGFFVGRALADRAALHAALDYVYTPSINAADLRYSGSLVNLRRALDSHRTYKSGRYCPLLSDFYSWAVFDHLILPDDKLARLENVFFGQRPSPASSTTTSSDESFTAPNVRARTRIRAAAAPNRAVTETALALRTAPAGESNTTVTLRLTLANARPSLGLAEYVKTLPLPAGVFVQGFRLSVNGQLVPGRIVEKKTALWVYTMIRDTERRDPGLLIYRDPGELELRVYPIAANSPATVEIDFLFPVTVDLPRFAESLRDPARALMQLSGSLTPQLTRSRQGTLLTGPLDPVPLPTVEREPYLHLIVDRSLAHGYDGDLAFALRAIAQRFPAARLARITLANHDVVDYVTPLTPISELLVRPAPLLGHLLAASGDLALDLAVAHGLRQHREFELDHLPSTRPVPPRPLFVILSRHAEPRTFVLDRSAAWIDLVPSLELYERGADATWLTHAAKPATAPLLRLGDSVRPLRPNRFIHFTPSTDIRVPEYWSPDTTRWLPLAVPNVQSATPWAEAAALHLVQHDYARSPGDAGPTLKSLVHASRDTGILLPETSYIVVENAAQWRLLEESERQKLGQNTALAFRETPAPSAWWLVPAFLLWLAFRHRRTWRPAILA
jgi:hypothetical protein